eukprot:5634665-Pleurochrysis_carterae.AAC.1
MRPESTRIRVLPIRASATAPAHACAPARGRVRADAPIYAAARCVLKAHASVDYARAHMLSSHAGAQAPSLSRCSAAAKALSGHAKSLSAH